MIYLNQNSNNLVALSLSELVTLTGSTYFLFNFKSDDTQTELNFTCADTSSYTERYNQFEIIESGSSYVNLTAGTINLPTPGYYHYKIYQMTGQTNLDISGTTAGEFENWIESGKVLVSGSSLTNITTIYSGASSLYIYN